MSYDKVLKVRLSDVQLKRLGELSLGIEGGMSGVVRSWIDSSLFDNDVSGKEVVKSVDSSVVNPNKGFSKFSPSDLQAMADRVKTKYKK